MYKSGHDHSDDAVLDYQPPTRRGFFAVYRWPTIFLGSLLGLLVLSEIIPAHHSGRPDFLSSFSQNYTHDSASHSQEAIANTFFTPENVTHPHPVLNAVLHPEQRNVSSPNKLWRLRLADNADLVLERNQSNAWSPIWWSNSALYKQRNATTGQRYVTLDRNGSLEVMTLSVDDKGNREVIRHWDSSKQRQCSSSTGNHTLAQSLLEQAVPHSLMLDNSGRLVILNNEGKISCILAESLNTPVHPSLHESVNVEVVEDEAVPEKNIWPTFHNSDKQSSIQIRAMFEADMARRNQTLELNATQLETIHNTAIIIPSYHGHLEYCFKFLRSMIRHCVDCDRFQINIIVANEDMDLFKRYMFENGDDSLSYWLPGLQLIEYEKMHFEHYAPEVDVAEETKKQHKLILQDFKKNHGCLVTGKRHCALLDSEGIFIRTTWYADVVKEYVDAPFVIHNPQSRNGTTKFIGWSTPVGEIFDIPDWDQVGWMLEYYSWFFDSSVYSEVARVIAEAYPLAKDSPQEFFTELCYWGYIWAKKGPVPGPEYKFITSEELLGERLYNITWNRYVYPDPDVRVNDRGIVEDIRSWMGMFPDILVPAAQAWERHGLRYFKAENDWWGAIAFLSIAKSVRLCVSEQPRQLYEAAMAGALNLD